MCKSKLHRDMGKWNLKFHFRAMAGRFRTDLQQTFGMLKYREDKAKLRKYINQNREYFGNIDRETYQAFREFLHSEKVASVYKGQYGR